MISQTDILNGKILIIDDLAPNIALLEQMLSRAGYLHISSTTDATQVCELHLVNHYDLILLDLMMPSMDGFQVMENLKEIETGSYLPVLVVTAQPDQKLRALKAGAKDFVSKPFDLAEVLLRVHNMLEVRLLHQETQQLLDRVLVEQKVARRLLSGVLPQALADLLRPHPQGMATEPAGLVAEGYAEVTVLFADLVAFTRFSEGASARVLAGALNAISARFDSQADVVAGLSPGTTWGSTRGDVEGAKRPGGPPSFMPGHAGLDREGTAGEAYLAAIGLSDAVAEHSLRAVHQAMDLIEAVDRFNERSRYKLKVRIGIDSTTAKAGKQHAHYDL